MKFFFRHYLKLLQQLILPILLITILSGTIDQLISLALENELRSPDGATSRIWYFASGSLANSLIFPWITNLLLLFCWQRQSLPARPAWLTSWSQFAQKFGAQSFIETLRGWGKCIIYSLFLIVPGIWKFLEYSFIPWIVCFDPSYDKGEVDALKKSTQMFRKVWLKMLLLFVLFILVIPLILTTFFEQYRLIWITPLPALALHFLDALTHILFFQIVTILFFNLLNQETMHESHI